MSVKRRQNLAETYKGSYYKEEWLEVAFCIIIFILSFTLNIFKSSPKPSDNKESFLSLNFSLVIQPFSILFTK